MLYHVLLITQIANSSLLVAFRFFSANNAKSQKCLTRSGDSSTFVGASVLFGVPTVPFSVTLSVPSGWAAKWSANFLNISWAMSEPEKKNWM